MQFPQWRRLSALACGAAAFGAAPAGAVEPPAPAAILQELRSFREMGSVLYVAAHPDDENTQLITWFARGRGLRTAYLSVTRGDGGQNVLGPEFDEKLGVARTQELLAARRLDGGRQFFTRAIDFGFSKDHRETLNVWDRAQVLGDVVRVIRTFRPDVVITRFSPQPGGTHGHHTASAVLAVEAFKLAGDPRAYPEQLDQGLTPWQPKRIFWNGGSQGRPGSDNAADLLRIDVSGTDPVFGESFAAIAARSRGMHKTQGLGFFATAAPGSGSGPRIESFRLLDGAPAATDIFEGVDTTWGRVPGGAEVGRLADEAIAQFNPQDPAASVPALLALRTRVAALPADPLVADRGALLDRILQDCLGLSVETTVPVAEVVPGEALKMHHAAVVRSSVPVRWAGVRYPAGKGESSFSAPIDLASGQIATRDASPTLPAGTPISQPYWLRQEPAPGTFRVADPRLIGRPENPPAFPVEFVFAVGGQTLVVADEPVQLAAGAAPGNARRRLEVIPPVEVAFTEDRGLFTPGSTHEAEGEITAARPGVTGVLRLETPAGWQGAPASRRFKLPDAGGKIRLKFNVTAPERPARASIGAMAEVGGTQCRTGRFEIYYAHIPPQLLQPAARLTALGIDLAIRGKKIGYLPGAGDDLGHSLAHLGWTVAELTGADLTAERLKGFDTVVIGVRAFNTREDLVPHLPALFAWVEGGGTVVAQYNRPGRDLKTEQLAPYSLRLSNDRVTDEKAAITFLAPDHPVLNTPNKISGADFEGWVQERGVYFPSQWDAHFTPILACGDPGETPLKGGLLVAQHGQGWFVYTGLAFFRQLPAGVPGAYRLLANLVSLGK